MSDELAYHCRHCDFTGTVAEVASHHERVHQAFFCPDAGLSPSQGLKQFAKTLKGTDQSCVGIQQLKHWTLHRDEFSGLYAIKDGAGHLVCEGVGKGNAEKIVSCVNRTNVMRDNLAATLPLRKTASDRSRKP